ncbi:MAG: DUF4870 domain-containing protein [Anaerolineales bacterium]|nr:DUF4870 domain-containing protein [Anaerolineales bacterium]
MSQAPMSPDVTSDDKLWAALSYFPLGVWPFISIIVLLMEDKKNRPYIKFNAIQSLVLGVIAMLGSIICGLGLLVVLYMFYLAYLAYQGQEVKVPWVTDFIHNQGWA